MSLGLWTKATGRDRHWGQRKDCHLIWSSLIGRGNFEKSGEGGLEETVSELF